MARCSIESPKYGIYIVRHKSVATGETFLVFFRPVLLISLVTGGAAGLCCGWGAEGPWRW